MARRCPQKYDGSSASGALKGHVLLVNKSGGLFFASWLGISHTAKGESCSARGQASGSDVRGASGFQDCEGCEGCESLLPLQRKCRRQLAEQRGRPESSGFCDIHPGGPDGFFREGGGGSGTSCPAPAGVIDT